MADGDFKKAFDEALKATRPVRKAKRASIYSSKAAHEVHKGVDIGHDPDYTGLCFGWLEEGMPMRPDPTPEMTRLETVIMSVVPGACTIKVKCAWNPYWINEFKALVSSQRRSWNTGDKCWEIHPDVAKDVERLCKKFYAGVKLLAPPAQGEKVKAGKFERLLGRLDKDAKTSVYRLLALRYHPDKLGGDHETMALVNEVFKQWR